MSHKIVIIGGGISGASTAIRLAKKGIKSVIFEKQKFPRDLVGEGLSAAIGPFLKDLGVLERIEACSTVVKKNSIQIVSPQGSKAYSEVDMSRAPFKDGLHDFPYGYNVKRADFDQIILDRARELGVEIHEETSISSVEIENEQVKGVNIMRKDRSTDFYTCDLVIDCSGRNSVLARQMSLRGPLEHVFDGQWANFAIRTHFINVDKSALMKGIPHYKPTTVNILPSEDCWYWFIPLDEEGYKISIGFVARFKMKKYIDKAEDKLQAYRDLIAQHPVLKEAIKDATMLDDVVATSRLGHMNTQMSGNGFLCVGDAAFFADPAWGTGATIALRSAELAAETIEYCVNNNDFSKEGLKQYESDYHEFIEAPFNSIRAYNYYYNDSEYVDFIIRRLGENQANMDMIAAVLFDFEGHEAFQKWTYYEFKAFLAETGRFPELTKVSQFDFDSGKLTDKEVSEMAIA